MSARMRPAVVRLVARRELRERMRERSFRVSTGVSVFIVALVVVLPGVLGLDGPATFRVGVADPGSAAVARTAARAAPQFQVKLVVKPIARADADRALRAGDVDAVLAGTALRAKTKPDERLTALLAAASRDARRPRGAEPPPLRVSTIEPDDPARDRRGGLAFFVVLLLYAQLLTYGVWVASGVVEEKASRVVEVLLATIRPRELLAGKVIGLGLLGLGQLLVVSVVGLVVARIAGAVDIDGTVVAATALSLVWFLLGYAFYACAFACAGALVPRLEELQASTTPLVLLILVSMFVAFGVNSDPTGTLAHVSAFIPMTAPLTLPPRILLGDASWLEVAGGAAVTIAASAALIPLAARIYSGAVLRTGSAVGLRDAWRARG